MTRKELIAYCLTLPGAYEDYPFEATAGGMVWTVMRHRENTKTFALLFERLGALWVNVKCEPKLAHVLRQTYEGVLPGYHMNKEHWNSIICGMDVPDEKLCEMLAYSFELTAPKRRVKKQEIPR